MTLANQAFIRRVRNPIRFRLFLLFRLPSAFFSGVRLVELDHRHALVRVPYYWFSQNPFRSTYFACLAMAAELSTGLLAWMQVFQADPPVTMLVTQLEARFLKKAVGTTYFLCGQGEDFQAAMDKMAMSGEPQTLTVRASGTNAGGDQVAEFDITWSFKVKKPST
jgi:hypothetical protein